MAYSSWNLSQSPEEIFINGTAIASVVPGFRTLNVSGRESLEYSISEENRPVGMDGTEYFGRNLDGRTITVRFVIARTNAEKFMQSYLALKRMCTESEELKLQFSDQPNCYYTGVLKSVSEPDPGEIRVIGEMQFYCADPYLYEDLITTVRATPEWITYTDGNGEEQIYFNSHLSAQIINDGSGEIYPTYKIQNNSVVQTCENGYVGIVHKGGALELGNPEESNSTQELLYYSMNDKGLSKWERVYDPNGSLQNTSLRIHPIDKRCSSMGDMGAIGSQNITGKDNPYVYYEGLTTENQSFQTWNDLTYGSMSRMTLTDRGYPNFYLWCQFQAVAATMGENGLLQVMLCDEADNFLAGIGIVKDDQSSNRARFVIWVDKKEFKRFDFETTGIEPKKNPFINNGYEDIQKEGGKWRFFYGGYHYETYVPEHEDKGVANVYVYCGRFPKRAKKTDSFSSDVNIRYFNVGRFKMNDRRSVNWHMVDNRYGLADTLEINTETDSILLNGIPANDELVTGSTFAPIPPSSTYIDDDGELQYEPITIDFYTSYWQELPPAVDIEYRRRWL